MRVPRAAARRGVVATADIDGPLGLALQYTSAGGAISALTNYTLTDWHVTIGVALVSATYTAYGGMATSILTDMVQGCVMFSLGESAALACSHTAAATWATAARGCPLLSARHRPASLSRSGHRLRGRLPLLQDVRVGHPPRGAVVERGLQPVQPPHHRRRGLWPIRHDHVAARLRRQELPRAVAGQPPRRPPHHARHDPLRHLGHHRRRHEPRRRRHGERRRGAACGGGCVPRAAREDLVKDKMEHPPTIRMTMDLDRAEPEARGTPPSQGLTSSGASCQTWRAFVPTPRRPRT